MAAFTPLLSQAIALESFTSRTTTQTWRCRQQPATTPPEEATRLGMNVKPKSSGGGIRKNRVNLTFFSNIEHHASAIAVDIGSVALVPGQS